MTSLAPSEDVLAVDTQNELPALSGTQRFRRRVLTLPASCVHMWKIASLPAKLASTLAIVAVLLVVLSEANAHHGPLREFTLASVSSRGLSTRRPLQARRTRPCRKDDPCEIQLVADLDHNSLIPGKKPMYMSKLLAGTFYTDASDKATTFNWYNEMEPFNVIGKIAEEGRGMELSELVLWNGELLAFDDRTGIVYELVVTEMGNHDSNAMYSMQEYLRQRSTRADQDHKLAVDEVTIQPLAKYILTEESGSIKGMKIEWACEADSSTTGGVLGNNTSGLYASKDIKRSLGKDGGEPVDLSRASSLYVGSFGKEYTTRDGSKITGEANFWVVRITEPESTSAGPIMERINWKHIYNKLRAHVGAEYPGYMIHEAVNYSMKNHKWYFLPRRVSSEQYDDMADEKRGSNIILEVSADFETVKNITVNYPTTHPRRGFSSFKFLPGTGDQVIIAIRSEEDFTANEQKTYLSIISVNGEVLQDEIIVSKDYKFEGIEVW